MKIRSKLSWTFIILLFFGITSISSYSIVFIRDYLLSEGRQELEKDTRWLSVTMANVADDSTFNAHFREVGRTSGYQLALYDSTGQLLQGFPDSTSPALFLPDDRLQVIDARENKPHFASNENDEQLISYIGIANSANPVRYMRVSQYKDRIYAPIKTIRWIIYYGLFISMGLVVIVSIWMGRYLTKPITAIKDAALGIAEGDVNREINLTRNDEFGTLAESLNRMAGKLRDDTEQIKQYAERQRQFFADITHEVRNPLHTISGALEMLAMDGLTANQRTKYRQNAQNQVKRMNRLFKDLVTLQRYDSDEYFIEKKRFNLATLSAHMQEWHGPKAAEKGLELNIDRNGCPALGDPGKIEQVLDNLISNAIKYTSEGSVALEYYKMDEQIQLTVTDTGIGISEEHLDRLFDRFYRTDNARSRDKGGTGLGLAVVDSILKAHGTTIVVESTPGKGSTFRFQLPAG